MCSLTHPPKRSERETMVPCGGSCMDLRAEDDPANARVLAVFLGILVMALGLLVVLG